MYSLGGIAEPPAGMQSIAVSEPSAPKTFPRMPTFSSSLAESTTAPEPSPNSTHVERSCQSSIELIFSELTTRAFLYLPDAIMLVATSIP